MGLGRSIACVLFLILVYAIPSVFPKNLSRNEIVEEFTKSDVSIIIGRTNCDSYSLTVSMAKKLRELNNKVSVFDVKADGTVHPFQEGLGGPADIISVKSCCLIDWSIFEAITESALQAKKAIQSLLQDSFLIIPLIWIIGEEPKDSFSQRIPLCETGEYWQSSFYRWRNIVGQVEIVVFSDSSPPMKYNMLDIENFLVKRDSPIDTWSAAYGKALAIDSLASIYEIDSHYEENSTEDEVDAVSEPEMSDDDDDDDDDDEEREIDLEEFWN